MSNLIVNIPDNEREDGCTKDAIKYKKDCCDFQCLDDGTITRECRYCNLSLMCRQTDVLPNGSVVPMEANFLPIFDANSILIEYQLFCTGMHDLRELKERIEDDKVS
jgi:hypothetical protein